MATVLRVGDKPRYLLTITDPESGALTDPSALVLEIYPPNQATQTHTYSVGAGVISRTSQGKYVCRTVALVEAGPHRVRWVATMSDGGISRQETEFMVLQ
jgi:hypothetical protein